MPNVNYLAETTVNMIRNYIQANIATALSNVTLNPSSVISADHVTTEPPRQYFIYAPIKGYLTPAVIIDLAKFDFRPGEKKANHVNAACEITIACLLEDRDEERLTIKCYRYNDAFYNILAQAEIVDVTDQVKLIVIVNSSTFTPSYSDAGKDVGIFRKELHLECKVEHYSNF